MIYYVLVASTEDYESDSWNVGASTDKSLAEAKLSHLVDDEDLRQHYAEIFHKWEMQWRDDNIELKRAWDRAATLMSATRQTSTGNKDLAEACIKASNAYISKFTRDAEAFAATLSRFTVNELRSNKTRYSIDEVLPLVIT